MPRNDSAVRERLLSLLCDATRASLAHFRRQRPDEEPYAFAYVCSAEGTHVFCACATEQGLTRVAQKYVKLGYRAKAGDTITLLREYLRWSNPDDGWVECGLEKGDQFLEELCAAFAQGAFKGHDGWTHDLCVDALKHLDAEGAFGTGAERERIVLGVTYGSDRETFAESAKECNPPAVWDKMRREMGLYHELRR